MDNYVVSFEQAKQLKAAGFPQDTVYKYYQVIVTGEVKLIAGDYEDLTVGGKHTRVFAAPIVDEVLNQLPKTVNGVGICLWKFGDKYRAEFEPDYEFGWTPVEAFTKLWLWCQRHSQVERTTG
ncbi:hypothetical protein ABIB48_002641 [Arthrobacter sp. UYCu511]|uniref:hypothetical protein n=1 Tax=Arthrobacter sp. UYCu511 TaxID=3156337 RepID=UPI00339B1521